jgi:hypothetical protein
LGTAFACQAKPTYTLLLLHNQSYVTGEAVTQEATARCGEIQRPLNPEAWPTWLLATTLNQDVTPITDNTRSFVFA